MSSHFQPARPAVVQDILPQRTPAHPLRAQRRPSVMHDIMPATKAAVLSESQADNSLDDLPAARPESAPVKSSLALSASPADTAMAPAAALVIPQGRFGSLTRDDFVWVTAGSLMAVLLMSCAATLGRLGLFL